MVRSQSTEMLHSILRHAINEFEAFLVNYLPNVCGIPNRGSSAVERARHKSNSSSDCTNVGFSFLLMGEIGSIIDPTDVTGLSLKEIVF